MAWNASLPALGCHDEAQLTRAVSGGEERVGGTLHGSNHCHVDAGQELCTVVRVWVHAVRLI